MHDKDLEELVRLLRVQTESLRKIADNTEKLADLLVVKDAGMEAKS